MKTPTKSQNKNINDIVDKNIQKTEECKRYER